MAFHQVTATSLTPSRPAPQAPQRRDTNDTYYSGASSNSNTFVSEGYKTSFAFNAPSASGSSYAASYSGIGASPIRQTISVGGGGTGASIPGGEVVRCGWAGVKEDTFASLFWLRKWLVLKEEELLVHKNDVSETSVCGWRYCWHGTLTLHSFGDWCRRHFKPTASNSLIFQTLSEWISSLTVSSSRQQIGGYTCHSRMTKRCTDGKTISIREALL